MTLFSRIISLLLAGAALIGFVSCARDGTGEPPTAPPRTELVVEKDSFADYTAEEKEEYQQRLTDITKRVVYILNGLLLQGSFLETVQATVQTDILPLLRTLQITPQEMQSWLQDIEVLCTQIEEQANRGSVSAPSLIFSVYRQTVNSLGGNRSGALLFALVNLWLDSQIELCDARYETYGYEWYLENGNRFREQKRALVDELGESRFSHIVSFLFVSLSSLTAFTSGEGDAGAGLLNGAEVLTVLKLETAYFLEQDITPHQWSLGVNMVSEWLLEDASLPETVPPVLSAQLNAMRRDSELFSDVGKVFAALLPLYHKVIQAFDGEDMEVLLDGDKRASLAVICRSVSTCESDFLTFADRFSLDAARQTEAEADALRKGGLWDAYLSYADTVVPTDAQTLLEAMKTYAQDPSDSAYAALSYTAECYLFGLLPYFTFAIISSDASR